MRQAWRLISIDNQVTVHFAVMGKIFWEDRKDLLARLVRPIIPSVYKSSSPITKNLSVLLASKLFTLPVEILVTIAEELLEDYLDLICFSLACVYLWEVTQKVRYRSLYAELNKRSWAGSRMILLGDHAKALPKGCLTREELNGFRLKVGEEPVEEGQILCELAAIHFPCPSSRFCLSAGKDERAQLFSDSGRELRKLAQIEQVNPWLSFDENSFTPVRGPLDHWMLRNLSKREFVKKSSSDHLTPALYSLIGWSDDPSVSIYGGELFLPGAWAGDRIDIELASIHEQEHENGSGWTDITASVAKTLKMIASENQYDEFEF
ncbi:hypothetical protein BDP27DRAFT_1318304 [Rhodocollybia butyracea]|uniref:Uncharacterized protein n=1 Tax=Rhodocollybia butyracea TaxID=206335 RepID=A0A9P5UB97_9AGAR|nr:hypothetical protein BDP27DRAFT_1318304 [Rhodocollybia butyracea]